MKNKLKKRVMPLTFLISFLISVIIFLEILIICGVFHVEKKWINQNIPLISPLFTKFENNFLPIIIDHASYENNINTNIETFIKNNQYEKDLFLNIDEPDIDEPDIDEPDIDEPDIDEPDIDEPVG